MEIALKSSKCEERGRDEKRSDERKRGKELPQAKSSFTCSSPPLHRLVQLLPLSGLFSGVILSLPSFTFLSVSLPSFLGKGRGEPKKNPGAKTALHLHRLVLWMEMRGNLPFKLFDRENAL